MDSVSAQAPFIQFRVSCRFHGAVSSRRPVTFAGMFFPPACRGSHNLFLPLPQPWGQAAIPNTGPPRALSEVHLSSSGRRPALPEERHALQRPGEQALAWAGTWDGKTKDALATADAPLGSGLLPQGCDRSFPSACLQDTVDHPEPQKDSPLPSLWQQC